MKAGQFHRDLGIPEDKPIPLHRAIAALRSAKRRGNKTMIERANYAVNSIRSAHKREK